MYNLKYKFNKIEMDDLIRDYYNPDTFIELCGKCKNYNNLWSCPPYNFSTLDYLKQYKYVYLISTQTVFTEQTINHIEKKDLKDFSLNILHEIRKKIRHQLLAIEEKYKDCISLYPGSCLLCTDCTRPLSEPCRNPNEMRYSLESLGFDVNKISNKLLNTEILWATDKLPEYFTSVSAIISNKKIDDIQSFF